MKFTVSEECIGCGACTYVCEEVFSINDDGIAVAIDKKIDEKNKEDAIDAMESCPVSAISYEEEKKDE